MFASMITSIFSIFYPITKDIAKAILRKMFKPEEQDNRKKKNNSKKKADDTLNRSGQMTHRMDWWKQVLMLIAAWFSINTVMFGLCWHKIEQIPPPMDFGAVCKLVSGSVYYIHQCYQILSLVKQLTESECKKNDHIFLRRLCKYCAGVLLYWFCIMDALMLPGYPRFLGGCPLLAIVAALLIV
jgi:hypothetical protein